MNKKYMAMVSGYDDEWKTFEDLDDAESWLHNKVDELMPDESRPLLDAHCYEGKAHRIVCNFNGKRLGTIETMDNKPTKPDDKIEMTIKDRIQKTQDTLIEKAKQYAQNGRLGNFKDIAELNDITMEKACWLLVSKHIIALKDYINEPDEVPPEQWDEKIGDIICYMHLLEAIIKTERE